MCLEFETHVLLNGKIVANLFFPAKARAGRHNDIHFQRGEHSNGQLRWSSLPRSTRRAQPCASDYVSSAPACFRCWTGFVLCVRTRSREETGERLQKHYIIELSTLFLTNMCCHLVSLVEWCALPFWNELFARVIKAPKVSSPLFKEFVLVLSMPHQLPN